MAYSLQWLRSLVFNAQMYLIMPLLGVFFVPFAIISRQWAFHAVHSYCRYVRWSATWMIGLKSEVRGTVPSDEVLIAAKHQSFFDIIILVSVLPRPKFIMKKELKWAPVLGWFALRIGCIPVDRGKRGAAITKMLTDAAKGRSHPGQLIIYPQGTRMAPGVKAAYKVGTAALYDQLQQDCVPVACNVGVFWPRHGVYRKPGLALIEFLPTIRAGSPKDAFLADLENMVETASDRLMAEAGFTGARE